jgi:DNA-binding NtrC family response regulator
MNRRFEIFVQPSAPVATAIRCLLEAKPWVCEVRSPEALAECWPSCTGFVIVVVDETLADNERFLGALQARSLVLPLLAVVSPTTPEHLQSLICAVADDFVYLPLHEAEFLTRVRRLSKPHEFEVEDVCDRLTLGFGTAQLAGKDPEFVRSLQRIPMMGRSQVPVLICGETGTGKELYARAIHNASPRRDCPFIPVDCASLPDHLIENELFGHVRGAFTDAHADQKGLISVAEGGTLFLDEVDSLSLMAQAKLLRLLQEDTYKPLGSERIVRANVRVIAATNLKLEDWVTEKRFRSDLYFRLNVLRARLPPLRERIGDIEVVARHLLPRLCAESGVLEQSLAPAVLRKLQAHLWPGNVRELLNVLQRALVYSGGGPILPFHVELSEEQPSSQEPITLRERKAQAVTQFERAYVQELLRKHHGNITRAAQEAGTERRTFGRLVKKYNLGAQAG